MTRWLLLLAVLLPSGSLALSSQFEAADTMLVVVSPAEECWREYIRCSFNTDRPDGEGDCFLLMMACVGAQSFAR